MKIFKECFFDLRGLQYSDAPDDVSSLEIRIMLPTQVTWGGVCNSLLTQHVDKLPVLQYVQSPWINSLDNLPRQNNLTIFRQTPIDKLLRQIP